MTYNDFLPIVQATPPIWIRPALDQFWGKPHQFLPGDFLDLSIRHKPILIREVYTAMWKYVSEQKLRRRQHLKGLVVYGHPGIGKSTFLIFAAVMAFMEKRPVAFCNTHTHFTLITAEGEIQSTSCADVDFEFPQYTLALYDSTEEVAAPPVVFSSIDQTAYLVHAASPKSSRWSRWSYVKSADFWVVEPWSREEVLRVQETLGPTVPPNCYTPIELFDILGPSARSLFQCKISKTNNRMNDFRHYVETMKSVMSVLTKDNATKLLLDLDLPHSPQPLGFHEIFYVVPEPRHPQPSNQGPRSATVIPTDFLRQLFRQIVQNMPTDSRASFIARCSLLPPVCVQAFNALALGVICQRKRPLFCHLHSNQSFELQPSSRSATFNGNSPSFQLGTDIVYLPSPEFAPIDAFIITDDGARMTLFQAATSSEHPSSKEGIEKIWQWFDLKECPTKWSLVFMSPSDDYGRRLSRAKETVLLHQGGGKQKSPERTIQLGWAVVDEIGGHYKVVQDALLQMVEIEPNEDYDEAEDQER